MTLAAIPSPPQGVWHLGSFPIRAYAICIILGIIVAIWLTRRRYAARGGNPEMVLDAAIVAVPAGIIGARIYHVITDNQKYFCETCDPVDALKITNGGLGIWGGVILGGLAVWAYFRYKKLPLAPFADAVAPAVILAQAIGRLGNWFNQELYGAETDMPWALEIYYRVDESGRFSPVMGRSTGEVMATVHPTFLYELLWNLLIFALLIWADRRFRLGHGRVFALYVAGYTAGRFWIEQMRTDEATMVFGMRINTLVSAVIFIGAVIVFFLLKKGREAPDEVDPRYQAELVASGSDSIGGSEASTAEAGDHTGSSPASDSSGGNKATKRKKR